MRLAHSLHIESEGRVMDLFGKYISEESFTKDQLMLNLRDLSSQKRIEEAFWDHSEKVFSNHSYNVIFEVRNKTDNPSDYFYILNTNNEVESNRTMNPYFGEINLYRVP